MAKLGINTGSIPNDGLGDSLLDGAVKINSNFSEIYNYLGNGTDLTAIIGTWVTTTVGIHTLKNVGIGTTNPTSTLTVGGNVSISGILTSSSAQLSLLSGTNSNYSGISTVGSLSIGSNQVISSGRELQNITSLDAATTATIESAIQSAPNNFSNLNVSGVSTLGNTIVGGATTQLVVNGDTRITGILTIGSSSITLNGSSNTINVGSGITINGSTGIISATSIVINGTSITGGGVTSITAGSGISVDQSTGNVTITATGGGGGSSQWVSTAVGIHTLSNVGIGTTNPTSALTVKGNTSLETLNVSGVSTFSGNSKFGDNNKILLGNDGDFEIYFDSSNTILQNSNTNSAGDLYVRSDETLIQNLTGTETIAQFTSNGAVSLYYDNSKKFETTNTGVTVTGNATVTNQLSVSGITSTKDLIVYGTGNDSGSISTMALMSRTNYLDFGPAIPNTSAQQSFAIRLGSDRATGTFGPYSILQASWTNPSGTVSLNNWNGTSGITIGDDGVFAPTKPFIIGTATSTGTASQTLQVTGGAYVSGSVGIGTTNPTSALTVVGNVSVSGVSTFVGNVFANDLYVGDYDRIFFGNNANLTIGYDTGNGESLIKNQTSAPFAIDLGSNSNSKLSIRTGFASTLAYFSRTNVELYESTNKKFETIGAGVTVTGTTFSNQLNVSGVSTFNGNVRFDGDLRLYGTENIKFFDGSNNVIGNISKNGSITYYTRESSEKHIFQNGFGPVQNLFEIGPTNYSYKDLIVTGLTSTTTFKVGTAGTVITTTSGGLVGIGTTNPTSTLTVRGGDISVGVSTAHGVILTSPNGTQYRLIVDDAGALSTVAV